MGDLSGKGSFGLVSAVLVDIVCERRIRIPETVSSYSDPLTGAPVVCSLDEV